MKERDFFEAAYDLIGAAQDAIEDKAGMLYARSLNIIGLVSLDLNDPRAAVESFEKALDLRHKLLPPDHTLVAMGHNNTGLAYTELGNFSKALTHLHAALDIRERNDIKMIPNSYSNLASVHLRMGQSDKSEEYMFKLPPLIGMTDEEFLDNKLSKENNRYAGDIVLLSRIRRAQGMRDDALRLASRALLYRRKLVGDGFGVCDSLYDVARLLDEGGNQGTALSMLREVVSIAEGLPGNHGLAHLARAHFRLSAIHGAFGRERESEACKEKALELRRKVRPTDAGAPFTEESFGELCPWMLW